MPACQLRTIPRATVPGLRLRYNGGGDHLSILPAVRGGHSVGPQIEKETRIIVEPAPSIHTLVERARQDDPAAVDALITQGNSRTRAVITSRLGPELQGKVDMDDLVQETFFEAWRSLGDFRWKGEKAFWAWLDTIAQHVVFMTLRRYRAARRGPRGPVGWLEYTYLKKAEQYLDTGVTPMRCHALRASCFVDPWGQVYPCGMYDRVVADLREHDYDLGAIWRLSETRALQREIWDYRCPQCWTPCEAYQSIFGNLRGTLASGQYDAMDLHPCSFINQIGHEVFSLS